MTNTPRSDPVYRPRLSIELTQTQADALYKYLDWGEKRRLFSLIIDDLIKAFETFGADKVIGAMKARELKLLDVVKLDLGESR